MSCKPGRMFVAAALMLFAALPVPSAAAAETESDGVYCFSCGDFAPESDALTGVCITGLPPASQGAVLLGNRVIRPGDVLTAAQLENMTFVPVSSRNDTTAQVQYLPIFSGSVAGEASIVISVSGKEDLAPVAEDAAVETYKNLPVEGLLKVSDPEDQALVFTVTRQPRRGAVIIREDGSFLYTPEKNKVGTDSFSFTAADPAGNVSREATVTVRLLKPTDSLQYADTGGHSCRFEAEWLRNCGIFSGEQISGQLCFSPGESVSRGQFLVMLMDTLGLPVDHAVTQTGFTDDAPRWLAPYLAAGLRAGIISGEPFDGGITFRWDQIITGQEAAALIQSALQFCVPTALTEEGLVDWSAAPDNGQALSLPQGDAPVTRADAALTFYRVSKLQERASSLSVFFAD